MDKKIFQNTILEKQYQPAKWQEVLKDYFGVKKIHQQPQPIILPANDIAENAVELGSFYTADDRLVGIYEITIKTEATTKIDINRVGLRNLLRNIYKYDVDAALIVFIHGSKWRFSYVSEIRTEEGIKETEPKRYTYLFGEGESCRTAADRFDKLKGKQIYLNDLFEAFSVEKLNKDFFKTYKEFHARFWEYLANDEKYYRLLFDNRQEDKVKQEKPIRDFAKKLLGRIVFLQFLQKKGWMGVSAKATDWIGGDPKFLQSLFAKSNNKNKFHSTELKDLFFKTLNSRRDNDIAPESLGKDIKIPYLNGGLFDKDISFENNIDFPEEYFAQLLDFFEQYNFTIDENDPYDSEVGIDPEMLGHIFENLLEENREKGAFYTPKEIVHYMCQESLIQYLRTHLPECTEDDSPATKALENFIRNGIIGDRHDKKNFVVQQAKRIEKLLDNVKICDPAIGSGAFPMGMLQEIFKAKTSLDLTLDHADVKRQIIQNNIYGVDIEPGAVDIARLRFWLALVVDETEPQPLPNLDYKIMQGNSLLEQFEDISLKFEKKVFEVKVVKEVDLFGRPINPQYTINEYLQTKQSAKEFDITELEEKYFNSNNADEKQQIREKIENFEQQFILEQLNEREKILKDLLQHKENDLNTDIRKVSEANAVYLRTGKKAKDIEKQKAELEKVRQYRKRLNDIKPGEKPWFLWHLYFMDVFDKGGFDIVIGNPPYFNIQTLGAGSDYAQSIQKAYSDIWMDKSDILFYFIRKGIEIANSKGDIFYIISNAFLFSDKGQKLRNFILNNAPIKRIINFENLLVFDSAMITTAIVHFKKSSVNNGTKALVLKDISNKEANLQYNNDANYIDVKLKIDSPFALINSDIEQLNRKIDFETKQLGSLLLVGKGMETAANDIFCNSEITKLNIPKEFIRRRLNGRAIKKFYIDDFLNEDILYFENVNDFNELHPNIKEYLINNKQTLSNRATVKNEGRPWWKYSRPMHKEFYKLDKLWTSYRSNTNCFALDYSKNFIGLTNTTVIFQTNPDISLKFICGLLNSKLLTFRYQSIGKQTGGGIFEYFENGVSKIPIKVSESELSAKITKLVENTTIKIDIKKIHSIYENKIDALVFHLYNLTEGEMLQVLDTFKDLSIKDRNQIQNEYWNIANNKFQLEI